MSDSNNGTTYPLFADYNSGSLKVGTNMTNP